VWDSLGNKIGFSGAINPNNWNARIDLGQIADGTYYFTIGNWPNELVSNTVDFNNVDASFALPSQYDPSLLYPQRGYGQWHVVINGVVPEPETWAMLLAGLAIVGSVARRRRHA
jgi:hypothetical protein